MNQDLYDKVVKHIEKLIKGPCPKALRCGIRYPDGGIWGSVAIVFKVPKATTDILKEIKECFKGKARAEIYPLVEGTDEYFLVVIDSQMTAYHMGIPDWNQ